MKLFVYGSLQHPLVWQRLLGKNCSDEQVAILPDWKVVKVKNEDYPGLIKAHSEKVSGVIKIGLSIADFEILDTFEGEQYQRTQLVVTDAQGQAQQTYVYVFKECYLARLSSETWSYHEFSQKSLARFLTRHF